MALHPQHHLHDQHAGDEHHADLEIVGCVTRQELAETDEQRTERDRRYKPRTDTGPQKRQAAARRVAVFSHA